MKILFVGVLDVPWSTHIPMVREFSKLNNKVDEFNFRTITKNYSLISESFYLMKYSIFKRFLSKINKYYGRRMMNRILLNNIIKNKYDLVFLGKAEEVNPKIISEITKYTKVWYFFMDPLSTALSMKAWKLAKYSTWASATFSDVNELFKKHGSNSIFLTQGVNPSIFCQREGKKSIDVIFVGTKTEKREQYINSLKRNKVKVECFGKGWINKPIFLEELASKYSISKIILNFTRKGTGFSIRLFQAMGTGSFVLSEYCTDINEVFKIKKHLDCFKNEAELMELVLYYLKNEVEREKIAKEGSEFVHNKYSWHSIIKNILYAINTKE